MSSLQMQVCCQEGKKIVLDKTVFDFTKNAFSRKFKDKDLDDFIETVNNEIAVIARASYDFSDQGETSSSIQMETPSATETETSSTTETDTEDSDSLSDQPIHVPGLRTTQQAKASNKQVPEDALKKLLNEADTDKEVTVDISRLQSGAHYLRETNPLWVEAIRKSIKENPNHRGAPLVAIASAKKGDFDGNKPNFYSYIVVGGCHQLEAVKGLNMDDPTNSRYKTRRVHVYGKEIEADEAAVSYLARTHNCCQKLHCDMTTQDKVRYCRVQYMNRSQGSKEWEAVCKTVLKLPKNGLTSTVLKLAALEDKAYETLLQVFHAFEEGQLKKQKINATFLKVKKPDFKPHNLGNLVKVVDTATQEKLLQELASGTLSLVEFKAECCLVVKRQETQREFVRVTDAGSWKKAEELYPSHATPEAMDRFSAVNLKRSKPQTWESFVSSAKRVKNSQVKDCPPQAYKQNDNVIFITDNQVAEISQKLGHFPGFKGADMTLLNIDDKNVTVADLSNIFKELRNVNLNLDKRIFVVLAFVDVEHVGRVKQILIEEECTHIEVAYVHQEPGKLPSGKHLLKKTTIPVVICVWSSHQSMPAPTTLVNRDVNGKDIFIGGVGGKAFIGRDVIGQIIETFSTEHQWLLTVNMKSGGDAAMEAIKRKRNCIEGVGFEEEREAHAKMHKLFRLNEGGNNTPQGQEESLVQDSQAGDVIDDTLEDAQLPSTMPNDIDDTAEDDVE